MGIEIKVPIEKLRNRKLFLAVPMYGGQCAGMFARSVADLSALCTHYGIQIRFYFLFNESLITRARNYCADEFMRSGDTHLMFIDSDIGFNANDVIALLALADHEDPDNNYDIICGPYPKKTISWEKIKLAVDKGFADENPNNLDKYVGDYVFNPAAGATQIPLGEPVEVLEAGTGFMMIKRKTFEKFQEAYPQQLYRPDHVRTEHFDGSRKIMAFFDTPIDPESERYLSEDYMFCVPGNTKVETNQGKISIKKIVEDELDVQVLSVSANGKLEYKPIFSRVSNLNLGKNWVRLETNKSQNLECTDDHYVAVLDNLFNPSIKYAMAKDVKDNYLINTKTKNSLYNKDQMSVLLGTIMGDATISKSGQVQFTHCLEQEEYSKFKANILNMKSNYVIRNSSGSFTKENTVQVNSWSPVTEQTKKLRELYSSGSKSITNIIPYLNELSLAIWFCDDGYYSKTGSEISTCGFTYEEVLSLNKMLSERWGIDTSIKEKKISYKNEERNYYVLRFTVSEFKKFAQLIAPYVPECMEYKLPEEYRGGEKMTIDTEMTSYGVELVKNIVPVDINSNLYDIGIDDNHNFFANGKLVHNCQWSRKIGLKVWLCPWMQLQHVGTYIFGGSLADLASIGASATADQGQLKKR